MGLNPENYRRSANEFGLKLDYVVSGYNLNSELKVKSFYESIRTDVVTHSKEEFENAAKYISSINIQPDTVVFDIGWNGSIQRFLSELLSLMGNQIHLDGYYFGLKNYRSGLSMKGYVFNPEMRDQETKISMMLGLVESFFLAKHGSTKGYKIISNGQTIPVLSKPDYDNDSREFKIVDEIQNGAKIFCKEYSGFKLHLDDSVYEMTDNILRLGNMPSDKAVEVFGDFDFNDTDILKMASPKSFTFYMFHCKELLVDYSKAPWKSGFLRRLIKCNFLFRLAYNAGYCVHIRKAAK